MTPGQSAALAAASHRPPPTVPYRRGGELIGRPGPDACARLRADGMRPKWAPFGALPFAHVGLTAGPDGLVTAAAVMRPATAAEEVMIAAHRHIPFAVVDRWVPPCQRSDEVWSAAWTAMWDAAVSWAPAAGWAFYTWAYTVVRTRTWTARVRERRYRLAHRALTDPDLRGRSALLAATDEPPACREYRADPDRYLAALWPGEKHEHRRMAAAVLGLGDDRPRSRRAVGAAHGLTGARVGQIVAALTANYASNLS